jgi:transcriptional regulator GlxA family with amidase domain
VAFRSGAGTSPAAAYRRIRLNEARRLLEQTRQSVAEIAGRCGYTDAAAMTRAFRREFGQSPREVRRVRQTDAVTLSRRSG